ncbi:hypothetical protein DM02DRAFT_188344 [Periconia macrospinosa]|uniref:Uncharacterized protein n=1 Tax=Periconia macrospinosa TaxID=97972 RepID=A0A2V1DAI1_9PLEO|nr:hypothetical protein DM02DRAFT_188344 [Periconia macrospinosa]
MFYQQIPRGKFLCNIRLLYLPKNPSSSVPMPGRGAWSTPSGRHNITDKLLWLKSTLNSSPQNDLNERQTEREYRISSLDSHYVVLPLTDSKNGTAGPHFHLGQRHGLGKLVSTPLRQTRMYSEPAPIGTYNLGRSCCGFEFRGCGNLSSPVLVKGGASSSISPCLCFTPVSSCWVS